MKNPFAEVVESSLTNITAQCWDHDIIPVFGQCIAVEGEQFTVYALVNHIETGPSDSLRRPSPFKKTIAELKKEQPQIFEFLVVTFTCVPLAYSLKRNFIYALPPQPPRIHEFIVPLLFQEFSSLFDKKLFLTSLFGMQQYISNIDELLFAVICLLHQQKPHSFSYYVDLLETYALLIGNEYKRVKLFAQRLEEML